MTKVRSFACVALVGCLGTGADALAGTSLVAGVNLSGMESSSHTLPGVVNYDYVMPSVTELKYYHGMGINLVRLPILWERMQPNLLASAPNTALSPVYLSQVQQIIANAATCGVRVVVDVHNYGGYAGHKIGGGIITQSVFAGFWRQLAAKLAGAPGLAGYDLMNEPNAMPNATIWPSAAQAAVTAIRGVDFVTPIYVEGDGWASAGSWTSVNNGLNIKDPARHLLYEAHVYGDHDNSGTHFTWATEAAAGVTVQTIAQRVGVFTGWCRTNARSCMIGEVGVGNDSPDWNIELSNGLAAMQAGGLSAFTYWAGGPWWGGYPMSLEPRGGVNAPQMSVVDLYRQ